MADKPGGLAAMFLSKKSADPAVDGPDDSEKDPQDSANTDLLDACTNLQLALKGKDPQAIADAFQAAFTACSTYSPEGEEDGEAGEGS